MSTALEATATDALGPRAYITCRLRDLDDTYHRHYTFIHMYTMSASTKYPAVLMYIISGDQQLVDECERRVMHSQQRLQANSRPDDSALHISRL